MEPKYISMSFLIVPLVKEPNRHVVIPLLGNEQMSPKFFPLEADIKGGQGFARVHHQFAMY